MAYFNISLPIFFAADIDMLVRIADKYDNNNHGKPAVTQFALSPRSVIR
jgi:hypothetical protein